MEYKFVKKGVFNLPEEDWGGFNPSDKNLFYIEANWNMANIMYLIGLFPSINQARKNGWNKEIPEGYSEYKRLGKMNKKVYIWNPCDQYVKDPNWGK